MTTRRIAVVGGGPRALWALERLLAVGDPDLRIDVLSRDGGLGAGAAYDVDQPDWLRLNVAASSVDAWLPDSPGRGPSFDQWRPSDTLADAFPPRRLVGSYLAEQAAVVLDRLGGRVDLRRCDVRDVVRRGDQRWDLHVDGGRLGPFDGVLLATGHEPDWTGALAHRWTSPVPLHPTTYPAEALRCRPELRPGATVVVRGAALTAIDAALTLARSAAGPDLRVVLVSRSGRLMHPKTEPAVLAGVVDVEEQTARAAAEVEAGTPVLEVVEGLARDLPGGRVPPGDGDAVDELRARLEMATGGRAPDAEWALGQAWRLAYPAMVARQARTDPLSPTLDEPGWAAAAARYERLAFGPPPVNAAALLALADSGVVEVRSGDAARVAAEVAADLVVDAVLAPPGVRHVCPGSLLGRLVGRGTIVAAPHGRGALVDGACRALDRHGEPVPGLALVGRATEDVVLGTDTLVRPLHPQLTEWARHA